jgi:sulfonate transport system substrate-binding protein
MTQQSDFSKARFDMAQERLRITRKIRAALASLILFLVTLAPLAMGQKADPSDHVLRIGYQKYGTLVLLKARGSLEKRLQSLRVDVNWTEFPAGPQLLEGLNVGSIDFGTVGEAPPIFAQAAGADLVYVGNEPQASAAEAIIVPRNSPIKSVSELKGKKLALNKGSNVHYLVVKLLEKAGIRYSEVDTVFLTPADARAAFERGSVDAWAIWEPFLAAAQKQTGARILADGNGVVSNHQFYLASRPYAQKRPDVVSIVLEEVARVDEWAKAHPNEAAAVLQPQIGLDQATLELALSRGGYGVKPVDDAVLAEQQNIADAFYDLKLIPKKINVRDATLQASSSQAKR